MASQDILINWAPQETRVAVVENAALQDLYIERTLERGQQPAAGRDHHRAVAGGDQGRGDLQGGTLDAAALEGRQQLHDGEAAHAGVGVDQLAVGVDLGDDHILGLHEKLFGRVRELNELNVRIQWIGRPFDSPSARTPRYVQRAIRKAIADTASNTGMTLTVAFDYGGRAELMSAVRQVRAEGTPMTPEAIEKHLYLPEMPPVDVMVRTSGELRVSNFLLWQGAGAKIYFTDASWPEFDADELDRAIALVR